MTEVGKHVVEKINNWNVMEVTKKKEDGTIERYYQIFDDYEVIPLQIMSLELARHLATEANRI